MQKYWRKDGWFKLLGILSGMVALALSASQGLSRLPWAEILLLVVANALVALRRVAILSDASGRTILAHLPGYSLVTILLLRHGAECAAIGCFLMTLRGILLEWRNFFGEPRRVLGSLSNVLWLPFLSYLRGHCYFLWGGTTLRTFEDCQRVFADPRNVVLPLALASILCTDVLNRLMQGVTLRLLHARPWKEAFGSPSLFQHLEDLGIVLGVALWTAWGWGTLPFTFLSMESHLMVAREWARRREASKQASCDPLTGLVSARGLSETLQTLLQRRAPFAVLFLDMDRFKSVNDAFGHAVGDELLQRVGEALTATIRPSDLAARRGGDEFVVVLPETDRRGAEQAAERLHESVATLLRSDPRFQGVGLSLGIALSPGDGLTEQALLDAADAAMYAQKKEQKRLRAA